MPIKSFVSVAALAAVTGLAVSTASASITIPTVPIGNPGNAPDPVTGNRFGSVAYVYNIGATEVTNAQYAAFLNAKAASDPYELYNIFMGARFGGIARSGSPGSYTYTPIQGRENAPVVWVSFWDACRFANWLHNGQGNGDTETGAYTLTPAGISTNTVARNPDWQWAVASEDEWYKAAYYQPASAGGDIDNYWAFPISSNAAPTISQANFNNAFTNTIAVGSFAPNYNGAFDMAGNTREWNEAIISGTNRGMRDVNFNLSIIGMRSIDRMELSAQAESILGFRVVQAPGPSCPACPADFDGNGGVDGGDLAAFFATFEDGEACADVDLNGGVDGGDLAAFFAVFENGGC